MEFNIDLYLGPEQCNHELMTAVYERAVQESKSPSHDIYHINDVLRNAWALYKSIPTNPEISWERIFMAGCLHDLGRNDPILHQTDSLAESIRLANPILIELGVPGQEIAVILEIIAQHDQPDLIPASLEALILKEADFLAGMGTTGVMRTILWAGESGRTIPQIVQTISERMPRRIASLQLEQSRNVATKLWPRAQLFLAQYQEELSGIEFESFTGKLIVFEGISGAGKGTQIQLLKEHIKEQGRDVAVISEPSSLFLSTLTQWKSERGHVDALERRFLLMADRAGTANRVKELLRAGVFVILDRSLISTMVYQGVDYLGMAEVLQWHEFFPSPDIVFLLDITAETALVRIDQSLTQGQRAVRDDYEEATLLETHRVLYHEALGLLPASIPQHIIDTSREIGEVQERIRELITEQGFLT
ncbi:MAG: dTMP kinase [Patescibacteria group bacterium]|nr:dTMP kinase [Patescibacteria group bacterium]